MIWLAIPAVAGAIYFSLVLIAALRVPSSLASGFTPPISILKPIHGRDERLYQALVSHAEQDYPEFELLFGVRDPDDPALVDIRRLATEYPHLPIRIVTDLPKASNGKVGTLIGLVAVARYPTLLVNDSDILVESDYLRRVAAPLENPAVGLVTCLYRARGQSFPARFEALGIATEFIPGVLVARLIGVAEFALGSTMAFHKSHLQQVGGFESIANYLADDYQLGKRIHELGLHIAFADSIVETNLGSGTWRDIWKHQIRWSRTIRVSRTGGYIGALVTHATFWSLIALLAGQWQMALLTMAIRIAAAIATGKLLKTKIAWWLIPIRDLWGFAIWSVGLFGTTVTWRDQRLHLRPDGCIK